MEYRLDLSTLLLMLRKSTGKLYSELHHMSGATKHLQILVHLEEGSITACSIKDKLGREVIAGETAVKLIQDQVLEWHYIEEQRSLPVPQNVSPHIPRETTGRQLVPVSQLSIPRRIHLVSQSEFLSWPRLYRGIYSLVDSKVTVHHIVTLLAREQSAEKVLKVLADLQQCGLIAIDRYPPAN